MPCRCNILFSPLPVRVRLCFVLCRDAEATVPVEPAPPSLQFQPDITQAITPNKQAKAKAKAKTTAARKKEAVEDPYFKQMMKSQTRADDLHENILDVAVPIPIHALK